MAVEKFLKDCESFRRKFSLGSTLLVAALTLGCDINIKDPVKIEIDDPIEIDPTHIGMIMGRVFSAEIINYAIVYNGYEGARVYILDTDFETTTISEGVYSIDNIPAGSYNVKACWPCGAGTAYDTKPVTVIKQETTTVADLKLILDDILHGKIYESDKITAFGNKEISLYGGTSDPWQKLYTMMTSSDGSYIFYRQKEGEGSMEVFSMKNSGVVIKFIDTDSEKIFIRQHHNIVRVDAYATPSN